MVVAGSKRNARQLMGALALGGSATIVLGNTSINRRRQKIQRFINGVHQILIIPNLKSVSCVGVNPGSLPVTHIVNCNMQGGMRQYRDTLELLQSRGLLTTLITSQDMAKWRLMASMRDHLKEVKQLPRFLQ